MHQLVQARMWAQGLTVAVVIASGVMAGMSSTGEKPVPKEDHSWRRVLGEFILQSVMKIDVA